MIGQFDFSEKGWVSGKGRGAVWREISWERKQVEPQFLMGIQAYQARIESPWCPKVTHMRVGSATNRRTAIGTFVCGLPGTDKAPMLYAENANTALTLTAIYNSLVYDFLTRARVVGLAIDFHVLQQNPLLELETPTIRSATIAECARALCSTSQYLSPAVLEALGTWHSSGRRRLRFALTASERLRLRAIIDALVATASGWSTLTSAGF